MNVLKSQNIKIFFNLKKQKIFLLQEISYYYHFSPQLPLRITAEAAPLLTTLGLCFQDGIMKHHADKLNHES